MGRPHYTCSVQGGRPDRRCVGGRACTSGERTRNMVVKSVTLDMSKLSGWLNADAYCRESKEEGIRCGARYIRVGQREAAGDHGASSV